MSVKSSFSDNSNCSENFQNQNFETEIGDESHEKEILGSHGDSLGPKLPIQGPPQAVNISASLKAYADRMQADYFRYRMAKESADNFYNRLAVFHQTFNPFRYYLNPFTLRSFGPLPSSPVSPDLAPGVDMSIKTPMNILPNINKPFPIPPLHGVQPNFPDISPKKRHFEEADGSCYPSEKKSKMCGTGPRRKSGKKTSLNDETSSPVSGTVIRQLGEGEALPEIRKGEQNTKNEELLLVLKFLVCPCDA